MSTVGASVIIPVHNDAPYLTRCLEALQASHPRPKEIIVVDDASSDHSGDVARSKGIRAITLPKQMGASIARNTGAAQAASNILVFIDADVLVQPSTIGALVKRLSDNAEIAAVFGSYDPHPEHPNFLSQYKNLLHHYVHQHGNPEAGTFWTACGAIRTSIFNSLGGFDPRIHGIEDIDLGYRLRNRGHRVRLDPTIQVTHLKRWTLRSWLHTDIFMRAVPWAKLMLEEGRIPRDLNLRLNARLSAMLVGALIPLSAASMIYPHLSILIGLVMLLLVGLDASLLKFFVRARGLSFALRAFPVHLLYYLYSGLTFSWCWMTRTASRSLNQIQPHI